MAGIVFSGVTKTFDDGTVAVHELTLEIGDGEFVVLVGPSGCGKTTALRMIAGLEEVTNGEILIGDNVVNNTDPRERDIAMVFQNYALYPHMSVYDNIAFGMRLRKVPRAEIRATITRVAKLLGLDEYLDRKPGQLSGGQRQRVAMGRAIVREPQAFLMDEPLSNLDARLRVQMRTEISRIQRDLGVTTIYVTHDQIEAMTMGDRVAVLRRGILQQFDSPQAVYDRPKNLFVASFIGSPAMNLLEATIEQRGDGLVCNLGQDVLTVPERVANAKPRLREYVGRRVAIGIRPEDAYDESSAPHTEAARLTGEIVTSEALGPEVLAYADVTAIPVIREEVLEGLVDAEEAEVVAGIKAEPGSRKATVVGRLRAGTRFRPGDPIELAIDTGKLHFFDLDSGEAIAA
jgi:multiple sugar transport system ATP-binding protein